MCLCDGLCGRTGNRTRLAPLGAADSHFWLHGFGCHGYDVFCPVVYKAPFRLRNGTHARWALSSSLAAQARSVHLCCYMLPIASGTKGLRVDEPAPWFESMPPSTAGTSDDHPPRATRCVRLPRSASLLFHSSRKAPVTAAVSTAFREPQSRSVNPNTPPAFLELLPAGTSASGAPSGLGARQSRPSRETPSSAGRGRLRPQRAPHGSRIHLGCRSAAQRSPAPVGGVAARDRGSRGSTRSAERAAERARGGTRRQTRAHAPRRIRLPSSDAAGARRSKAASRQKPMANTGGRVCGRQRARPAEQPRGVDVSGFWRGRGRTFARAAGRAGACGRLISTAVGGRADAGAGCPTHPTRRGQPARLAGETAAQLFVQVFSFESLRPSLLVEACTEHSWLSSGSDKKRWPGATGSETPRLGTHRLEFLSSWYFNTFNSIYYA